MTDQANQENSSSDRLAAVLSQLTTDQIRFVIARQEFATDKEAAGAIGIKPDTVYQWKHRGILIDEAVRLMVLDGIVVASELRRRHLAKAMAVKVAGLDSGKENMRQAVATEIIEWEMGKATQRQEVSGPAGGPIEAAVDGQTFTRAISSLADAVREILSGTGRAEEGHMGAAEQASMAGPTESGR